MKFDNYKNKMKYPVKPVKKCSLCNKSFKEGDCFCSACGNNVKDQRSEELEYYKKYKSIYDKESRKLFDKFKNDALDYTDLLEHPKADKIFDFAWAEKHSGGYSDVYYYLMDLSELF